MDMYLRAIILLLIYSPVVFGNVEKSDPHFYAMEGHNLMVMCSPELGNAVNNGQGGHAGEIAWKTPRHPSAINGTLIQPVPGASPADSGEYSCKYKDLNGQVKEYKQIITVVKAKDVPNWENLLKKVQLRNVPLKSCDLQESFMDGYNNIVNNCPPGKCAFQGAKAECSNGDLRITISPKVPADFNFICKGNPACLFGKLNKRIIHMEYEFKRNFNVLLNSFNHGLRIYADKLVADEKINPLRGFRINQNLENKACPAGFIEGPVGSYVCLPCGPGQTSNDKRTSCHLCPGNTFKNTYGGVCKPCGGKVDVTKKSCSSINKHLDLTSKIQNAEKDLVRNKNENAQQPEAIEVKNTKHLVENKHPENANLVKAQEQEAVKDSTKIENENADQPEVVDAKNAKHLASNTPSENANPIKAHDQPAKGANQPIHLDMVKDNKNKVDAAQKQIRVLEQKIDYEDDKVDAAEKQTKDLEQKIDYEDDKVEYNKEKVLAVDEDVKDLKQQADGLSVEVKDMEDKIEENVTEMTKIEKNEEKNAEKLHDMESNIDDLQNGLVYSIENIEKVDAAKKDVSALKKEVAQNDHKLEELVANEEESTKLLENRIHNVADTVVKIGENNEIILAAEDKNIRKNNEKIIEMQKKYATEDNKVRKNNEKINELQKKYNALNQKMDAWEHKYDSNAQHGNNNKQQNVETTTAETMDDLEDKWVKDSQPLDQMKVGVADYEEKVKSNMEPDHKVSMTVDSRERHDRLELHGNLKQDNPKENSNHKEPHDKVEDDLETKSSTIFKLANAVAKMVTGSPVTEEVTTAQYSSTLSLFDQMFQDDSKAPHEANTASKAGYSRPEALKQKQQGNNVGPNDPQTINNWTQINYNGNYYSDILMYVTFSLLLILGVFALICTCNNYCCDKTKNDELPLKLSSAMISKMNQAPKPNPSQEYVNDPNMVKYTPSGNVMYQNSQPEDTGIAGVHGSAQAVPQGPGYGSAQVIPQGYGSAQAVPQSSGYGSAQAIPQGYRYGSAQVSPHGSGQALVSPAPSNDVVIDMTGIEDPESPNQQSAQEGPASEEAVAGSSEEAAAPAVVQQQPERQLSDYFK